MIFAIDFDGVLCKDNYPKIGAPIINNIKFVKELKERGNTLILWTCRSGKYLDEAVEWCKSFDIYFDCINKNTQSNIEKFGNDSRKIFADYYIDDKSAFMKLTQNAYGTMFDELHPKANVILIKDEFDKVYNYLEEE